MADRWQERVEIHQLKEELAKVQAKLEEERAANVRLMKRLSRESVDVMHQREHLTGYILDADRIYSGEPSAVGWRNIVRAALRLDSLAGVLR